MMEEGDTDGGEKRESVKERHWCNVLGQCGGKSTLNISTVYELWMSYDYQVKQTRQPADPIWCTLMHQVYIVDALILKHR